MKISKLFSTCVAGSSNNTTCRKMADEEGNSCRYCKVCRVHYENGRKHRYGRKHIKAVCSLVNKFRKKVVECQQYIDSPKALDGELEPGATFWCHFCEQNVSKHVTNRTATIKFGGLFQHFASPHHHRKIHAFWKENGGDNSLKEDFLISANQYSRYLLGCQESLEMLSENIFACPIETAENLELSEMERLPEFSKQPHSDKQTAINKTPTITNAHGVMQNVTGWHRGVRVWKAGIIRERPRHGAQISNHKLKSLDVDNEQDDWPRQRLGSNLPALSFVKPSVNDKAEWKKMANIHTGALPPWLGLEDDDNDSKEIDSPEIGPSFEEFKLHAAKSKKTSKARCVGENFDHSATTSDHWLPSFGRVWNSGPRWQSRREYRKEKRGTSET